MSSLLLLNGSPRGPRSNSMRMMARVDAGWTDAGGEVPRVLHLAKKAEFQRAIAEFAEADTVLLGMPLYTDSMPGVVAAFIEALEPLVGREGNPRVGFLVQSGFAEAVHSRGLERYLAKLATRLGCEYAGTIVRGGGESLQMISDNGLRKLFGQLEELGGQLARDGRFASETLARVAGRERFSPVTVAFAPIAMKLPFTQFYWNNQLKRNGAWDRRFDAPYAPAAR